MDEYYPILTEDSYVDQGYTVRISRMDTMTQVPILQLCWQKLSCMDSWSY